VFVGWGIFFITALVKFNRRANPKAITTACRTMCPRMIENGGARGRGHFAGVLFHPVLGNTSTLPQPPRRLEIRVVAEQFAWTSITGKGRQFGKTESSHQTSKQSHRFGHLRPGAKDDITTVNQLHIPIGRPAIFI